MRNPTYLTPDDEAKILSHRGIKRPGEVSKEFKIGLSRLYKIWSKTPYNAVTSGSANAYKEARRQQLEKQRELAEELSTLRSKNAELEAELIEAKKEKSSHRKEFTELKKKVQTSART